MAKNLYVKNYAAQMTSLLTSRIHSRAIEPFRLCPLLGDAKSARSNMFQLQRHALYGQAGLLPEYRERDKVAGDEDNARQTKPGSMLIPLYEAE